MDGFSAVRGFEFLFGTVNRTVILVVLYVTIHQT